MQYLMRLICGIGFFVAIIVFLCWVGDCEADLYQRYPGLLPADYDRAAWDCAGNTCWHRGAPKVPIVIWSDLPTGQGVPTGSWQTIDLAPFVPPGEQVRLVNLAGIVALTRDGTKAAACFAQVYARRPGSIASLEQTRIAKPYYVYPTRTLRPSISFSVPVVGNKFEFRWDTMGARYPTGCAYGIWLAVQSYVR